MRLIAVFALALTISGSAHAAPILYGTSGSFATDDLLLFDSETGALVSTIGHIGFTVTGLAFNPIDSLLYGVTGAAGGAPSLIQIDANTGAGTMIGTLGAGLTDIAFDSDGTLYGIASRQSIGLFTVDLASGAATSVGGVLQRGGITFDSSGRLLFSNGSTALQIVDTTTGLATGIVSLSGSIGDRSLDYDAASGLLFGSNGIVTADISTGTVTNLSGIALDSLAIRSATPTQVPEPSSLLLFGSAVAFASVCSRTWKNRR